MRFACLTFLLLLTLGKSTLSMAQVGYGTATLFNNDWYFDLEGDSLSWQPVTLPHDWSVDAQPSTSYASCMGYLPGGIGHYKKTFRLEPADANTTYTLYFEGIYNRSEVYLNGHKLGYRPNGYVSFAYDLTPWLQTDSTNLIEVKVDHSRQADSRYYTGSGIYRNVWIVQAPQVHLAQWGLAYQLDTLTDTQAQIHISASTLPIPDGSYSLQVKWADASGQTLSQTPLQALTAHGDTTHHFQLTVSQPHLWQLHDPYLYRLTALLYRGSTVIDSTTVQAGIRSIDFHPDHGFSLNGQQLKMKGVCLHHDAGVLGAAVPKEVWYYRLQQLKDLGVNAIRTGHNPQSPDFYQACDALGLLVMDEAFDEWEYPKRKWQEGWNVGEPAYQGSYDFFETWSERDLTDMVLRDRTHPCIVLWSIGNEVDYPNDPYTHPVLDGSTIQQPMYGGYQPERPHAERIGTIGQRLAKVVRSIDTSRPVTGALAGVVMSNETSYPGALDVVGYNYTENRYDQDHQQYPDRIIFGSETGVNYPQWIACRDREFICGQFLWTGIEYLGESGRWPSRGLGTGLLDFTGQRKPRGWFRASLWQETPTIYLGSYPLRKNRRHAPQAPSIEAPSQWWSPDDSATMRVVCYTNAPQAQLCLNGQPWQEAKPYNDSTGIIYWDVPYQAGELSALALDSNQQVLASYTIPTTGPVANIRITPSVDTLQHRGDVALVWIEAVDANQKVVAACHDPYTIQLGKNLRLLGLETGSNNDMSQPHAATRHFYRGRLLAYVQALADHVEVEIK